MRDAGGTQERAMNPKLVVMAPLLTASLSAYAMVRGEPTAHVPAATPGPAAPAADPAAVPMLVTPAWLAAHVSDPKLVLLHVGDEAGYGAKHIAGARRVELSDIAVGTDHPSMPHLELPAPDDLRGRLERLGISNDSRIVVYFGEDWVSPATRVVLTLDAAGLGAHTGLLDGGMAAWQRAGHAVTAAVPAARTGKLTPLVMRPIIVDATTVLSSLGKPGFAVVDARNTEFYDGTKTGGMPGHQHRAGHIAGAHSVPFDSVFDDHNALRSPDDLKARFARAGVKPGDTVIGYCHIGQQATAMLFAARRLGHPVLLYDGSFEDWSINHPAYPIETSKVEAGAKSESATKTGSATTDSAPKTDPAKTTQSGAKAESTAKPASAAKP
jgi:thiosulfate/3-mercaptopyruvate sulfurtransferase